MASNTQLQASIKRSKSSGNRLWFGILAAVALVTLPVLPLKFLGIPGPELDWDQVTDIGKNLITRIKTSMPATDKKEKATSRAFASTDIRILDETAKVLISEAASKPDDPSLHNRLGLVYAELGELNSAVTHFQQSIKSARSKIRELNTQSSQAKAAGELKKASRYMLEVSALNVQLAASHSSLARVWEQLGRSDRVLAQLEELNRDVTLAGALKQAPKLDETVNRKEAASRLDHRTAAMLAKANALKQSGRGQDALEEYKRLVTAVPDLAIAHEEYGLTALAQNNTWLAQQELKKTTELNPEDGKAHAALGSIYLSLGKFEEARSSLEKALVCNPNDGQAAYNLGNIYADTGQYKQAISAYERAIKNQPGSAHTHNNLATMYSQVGDYHNSVEEFRKAIALSPDMASAHYGLGLALMNSNQYSESASAFKKAIALNPALTDAHNKLETAKRKAATSNRMHVN